MSGPSSAGRRCCSFPDQHLGRNTGVKLGVDLDEMVVWNPFKPMGGHTEEELRRAKIILWQGHCSVHTRFKVSQIEEARRRHSDVNVVVHPECFREVVEAADMDGSTEYIIRVVNEAPAGSVWAVGTEISLVQRLAQENPDKTVFCLDSVVCPCSTMYRIHPAYRVVGARRPERGRRGQPHTKWTGRRGKRRGWRWTACCPWPRLPPALTVSTPRSRRWWTAPYPRTCPPVT